MSKEIKVYKDSLSEENLAEHAKEIHRHHTETVKFMARTQIEVGRILLKARAEFIGDKEFGQWRQERTPIGSRQTATKLMELARQFESGRITDKIVETLPTSTLFELLSAPTSVINTVAEKAENGEVMSQKKVREEVKKEKQAEPESDIAKANKKAAEAKEKQALREQDNAVFDDAKYNDLLQSDLRIRIAEARKVVPMKEELAWVVFGIPPFAEGLPHEDVIQACYSMYMNGKEYDLKPDQEAIVTKAYKRLMNFYK